jgi:hypothetical protein
LARVLLTKKEEGWHGPLQVWSLPFFKMETPMALHRFRTSVVLAVLVAASWALPTLAASILTLYYDPDTGNMKLQNTTGSEQFFQSYDITTVGNGTFGPVSGLPGDVGFLSQNPATQPTAQFVVPNFNPNGANGLYSQAGVANVGSAVFSLSAYPGWSPASPIGPAGSYWDLGNIAVLGMTQAQLDSRFVTDPELTPPDFDTAAFGKFLFSYQLTPGSGPFSVTQPGDIVEIVPEPTTSTIAMIGLAGLGFSYWRRRRAKSSL